MYFGVLLQPEVRVNGYRKDVRTQTLSTVEYHSLFRSSLLSSIGVDYPRYVSRQRKVITIETDPGDI